MRTLLRILTVARSLWPYYLAIVGCSVLMAVTSLAIPFVIKAATDAIVDGVQSGSAPIAHVLWLAVALLAVELCATVLTNVGGYLGDTMAARLRTKLSTSYYEKLLALPQRYFDNEITGKIINRLSRSITEVTGFLNAFANSFFQMLLTVAAVLVITAFYSWPLALLLAVVYPVFMWLTTMTSVKWQALEAKKNHEFDVAGGRFAEVIGQIKVVKSFVQERRELTGFGARYETTIAITSRQSQYWHWMDSLRRIALNVIFFGIFAIIFVQTARGVFSIGVMVLLIQLVNMAKQPVFSMSYMVDFSQRAMAGSRDYFAVMEEPSEAGTPNAVGVAREINVSPSLRSEADQEIVFDNLSFAYQDDTAVLRDVNFSVRRGERVAFVGESGGGKTTLVSLLLRLYEPQQGRILVAGADISELSVAELRDQIGVVFQDPSLFSGTIRENISYARPGASEEEIVAAARSANAHEFIENYPLGYDSEIGERGLKLSGGQKQRIAVARAILKDAPILVLDEATSSLDGRSERLVQEGLDRLMADRTTLIIAHRLSTISSVQQIITLRDGTVDEIGSPDELAGTQGIYAELLALQASASKKDRKRMKQYDIQG